MSRLSSPRLVGRDSELHRLTAGFHEALEERPGFVLVGGEAGVGKSRLLEEHLDACRRAGAWVLSGACVQLGDASLPYGPFLDGVAGAEQALADRLGAFRDLGRFRRTHVPSFSLGPGDGIAFADPAPTADAGDAVEVYPAVLEAIHDLTRDRPLVVALDDIHWIDTASRDLLGYVVRRVTRGRVQVIATYRSDALHRRHPLLPFLGEAERWPRTEILDVGRLDRAAVLELVETLLDAPAERDLVDRVFERSDGNPFFVEELISGDPRGGSLARSLQQVLGAHIARLGDDGHSALRAASVIGRRVPHDLLVATCGLPTDAVTAAIRECADLHLLVPVPRAGEALYEFRHALVQEAAYDELLPAERVEIHRHVAAALLDGRPLEGLPGGILAQIAFHAHAAHDSSLALGAAIGAGRVAAETMAYAEASRYFDLALELWDRVGPADRPPITLPDLLGLVAVTSANANDPHRAARTQLRRMALLEDDPGASRAALLHELFWYRWEASEATACIAAAEQQMACYPTHEPSLGRATALADLGFARWSVSDYTAAERLGAEAVAVARAIGDQGAEGRGLHVQALGISGLGRMADAVTLFEAADGCLRECGDVDSLARNGHWWANTLELAGEFEEGVRVAERALEDARRGGLDLRHGDTLRAVIAENQAELGRWHDAEATTASAFDWGRDLPSEIWLHSLHCKLSIYQGQWERARRHLDAAERVPALGPDRVWQLENGLMFDYATGRVAEARAGMAQILGLLADRERDSAVWMTLAKAVEGEAEEALRARAAGDAGRAAQAVAEAERLNGILSRAAAHHAAHGSVAPALAAHEAWAAAHLERARGNADPAAWRRALARREAIGQAFDAAAARVLLADALLSTGVRGPEAAALLRDARATADRLEVAPLLARIDELARVGRLDLDAVPGDGRDDGAAPADDTPGASHRPLLGLSPRELEVLALVGEGRSNREIGEALFISAKTASVHVTHILEKLGVTSRVQAALMASRMDLSGDDSGGAAVPPGTPTGPPGAAGPGETGARRRR